MRLFGLVSTAAMAPLLVGGVAALGAMTAVIAIIVAVVAAIVAFHQASQGYFKNFIILMGVVAIAIGIIPAIIIASVILIITQWSKITAMFNTFVSFLKVVGGAIKFVIINAFKKSFEYVINLIEGVKIYGRVL